MKQIIFSTILALLCATSLLAQKGETKGHLKAANKNDKNRFEQLQEELKVEKVAYFSHELELSVEEAQKFWPIYNKYAQAEKAIRDKYIINDTTSDGFPVRPEFLKMSDKDAQKALADHLKEQEEINNLQKQYSTELQKAVSVQKVLKLFFLERSFMANAIGKRWQEAKEQPPMPPEGQRDMMNNHHKHEPQNEQTSNHN